jgi:hypothetical protein
VQRLADQDTIDKVVYLDQYKRVLNAQGGRSFYNMTGFGDISILAGIHAITSATSDRQGQLFRGLELIVVYTDDGPLSRRINQEFAGKNVKTLSISNIT